MALRKVPESLVYARKQFDLLFRDGVSKGDDAVVLVWRDRVIGELLEAVHQRTVEALQSIAMCGDRSPFAQVEMLPHLFIGMYPVVKVGDERRNRALEIDIVLPKRVIRIEEEILATGCNKIGVN